MRIGAVWMLVNLVAAAFLGTEFVVQEIRNRLLSRHGNDADHPVGGSARTSGPPRC